MKRLISFTAVLLVLMGLAPAPGCTYKRVVHDDMTYWRNMATKPEEEADFGPTKARPSGSAEAHRTGWAVQLAMFSGKDQTAASNRLLTYLDSHTTIHDAWAYRYQGNTLVLRGQFSSSSDPAAQEMLHKIRQMKIEKVEHFTNAQLVPYGEATKNAASPADLSQFAGMNGYTLQIAFFDKAGGSRFKEAAEEYCRQLREKGEQAYYYHGPNHSLVTIGLFTDSDWEGQGLTKHYGQRIRELQKRFPNNLGNGATVVEKSDGKFIRNQPSVLVHLPR